MSNFSSSTGMTGQAMWAELTLLSNDKCRDLLRGSQDDWDGFEKFEPDTEVCAAKLSNPAIAEIMVIRMPQHLSDATDRCEIEKEH